MKPLLIIIAVIVAILAVVFVMRNDTELTDTATSTTPSINVEVEQQQPPEQPVATTSTTTPVVTDEDEATNDGAPAASTNKTFNVAATNHAFSVKEMRVKKGDTVTINLTNSEGFHDWVIDEFDAATEKINTGGSDSVTFVADEAGTFEYYCSVGNHRAMGMVGKLIVE